MKTINVPLDDDTHEALSDVKGDRSWQEALIEEFGIGD